MLLWCNVIHSGSMYRVTLRQRPVILMWEVHVFESGVGGGLLMWQACVLLRLCGLPRGGRWCCSRMADPS
jgi:hypothetical protein